MKPRSHLSAAQMALLTGAGGLIMATTLIIPGIFYDRFHHSTIYFRLFVLIPPFLLGMTLTFLAGHRLKRGIQNGRWPAADIEALRARMEHRLWTALYVACIAIWSLSLLDNGRYRAFTLAALPLYLAISTLQTSLRRPFNLDSTRKLQLTQPTRLTSTHWGQH